jgi:hypothetical protein
MAVELREVEELNSRKRKKEKKEASNHSKDKNYRTKVNYRRKESWDGTTMLTKIEMKEKDETLQVWRNFKKSVGQ